MDSMKSAIGGAISNGMAAQIVRTMRVVWISDLRQEGQNDRKGQDRGENRNGGDQGRHYVNLATRADHQKWKKAVHREPGARDAGKARPHPAHKNVYDVLSGGLAIAVATEPLAVHA